MCKGYFVKSAAMILSEKPKVYGALVVDVRKMPYNNGEVIKMDMNRRKELLNDWKHRRPEMGVFSVRCKVTGDLFLGVTNETKTGFNRHRFQLSAGFHPNKKLQELWNRYGENEFEYAVVKVLKYDDPTADQKENLKDLLAECVANLPEAELL